MCTMRVSDLCASGESAPCGGIGRLHVLIGDFDDEFRTKWFPGKVLALTPAALAAGHAELRGVVAVVSAQFFQG